MIFNVVVMVVVVGVVPKQWVKIWIKKFFKKTVKQIDFTFSTNSTEREKQSENNNLV